MKTSILGAALVAVAGFAMPAQAAGLLGRYSVSYAKAIDTKEASAVAYNWDTRTLVVTNDEEEDDGTSIWGEYDLDGNKVATVTLGGCLSLGAAQCDPEGLTYVGGGRFVVAEERYQDIALLSQVGAGGDTRTYTDYDDAPTISIGQTAGNSGLEGIAYDRRTGLYYGVKETSPQTLYQVSDVDFGAGTASVTTLFDPAVLGLNRLSDIATLSNKRFGATAFGDHLLILSGRSFLLLEVTKSGTIVGSYDLSAFKPLVDPANQGGKFEGLTLDDFGNIYLVSDDGDGPNQSYLVKLGFAGAVPEPSSWALMVLGFGSVAAAMRRRRRPVAAIG